MLPLKIVNHRKTFQAFIVTALIANGDRPLGDGNILTLPWDRVLQALMVDLKEAQGGLKWDPKEVSLRYLPRMSAEGFGNMLHQYGEHRQEIQERLNYLLSKHPNPEIATLAYNLYSFTLAHKVL